MIRRLFERGVRLRMGSREIRAGSARELLATLIGLSAVTPARMAELAAMGDRALALRASALDDLGARVSEALARRDAEPASLLARLHTEDTPLERHWADALAGARSWNSARGAYQRALLEALVEHLSGERDCVRTLLANRVRPSGLPAAADADTASRQQLVFDAAALAGDPPDGLEFNRMPKGDPLEIALCIGQAVQIMLARHRFLIVSGTPWLLVDEFGEDCKLRAGRNLVGRSTECDAMVHDSYRAISRRHAVLETEGTALLRLTDISSLGTFVPRAYLDNRLH
jgi:hypothetical protein